jgi:hypothetical protein
MPADLTRTAKVVGAAVAIDYFLGNQILSLIPEQAMPAEDSMKSAMRTGIAVAAADLLLQNM